MHRPTTRNRCQGKIQFGYEQLRNPGPSRAPAILNFCPRSKNALWKWSPWDASPVAWPVSVHPSGSGDLGEPSSVSATAAILALFTGGVVGGEVPEVALAAAAEAILGMTDWLDWHTALAGGVGTGRLAGWLRYSLLPIPIPAATG